MATSERATIKLRQRPQRLRFGKRALEAITPPGSGRHYVYDEHTPSLALCITASGKRTFYLVKKIDGRTVRLRLGTMGELTVENARKMAAKELAKIADGGDPQAERRTARAEMSLGEAFSRYMTDYARPHKKTADEDERRFNKHLKPMESRQLSKIKRADVLKLHAKIGDSGKYEANRTLALLSKMFSFCNEIGWEGPNPCKGVKPFKEKSRDRFLQADELPKFLSSVEADQSDDMRDFFRLALLTGCRIGNLMAAEWSEFQLGESTWRIPETKSGDSQRVHLPAAAVDILTARRRRLDSIAGDEGPSEFLFPSRAGTRKGHITDIYGAWRRICKRAGITGIRPHDLRRTLGSWEAATGASLHVIGKSLGHTQQSTTAIYARLNIDPVRAAVDTAVAAMLTAGKDATNEEEK